MNEPLTTSEQSERSVVIEVFGTTGDSKAVLCSMTIYGGVPWIAIEKQLRHDYKSGQCFGALIERIEVTCPRNMHAFIELGVPADVGRFMVDRFVITFTREDIMGRICTSSTPRVRRETLLEL